MHRSLAGVRRLATINVYVYAALILAFIAPRAPAQDLEWSPPFGPTVWYSTPEAAIYAYADWYCAQPGAIGTYINCTPDYITPGNFAYFFTRL
jgi:hypothetical protein